MTFFGALGTAVSGVNAAATWVGHISDNIANSTTTGYKAVNTQFTDLVRNKVIGESPVIDSTKHGGVTANARFENRAQGGYFQTLVSTNVAVTGQGFIPVARAQTVVDRVDATTGESDRTVTTDGQVYFTRAGDFHLDAGNYLINSNGYYLMASPTGSTTPELLKVDDAPIDAIATSTVDFTINLPANAAVGATSNQLTTTIYDATADGNTGAHGFAMEYTKVAANQWDLVITSGDTGQTSFGPITLTFADGSTPPFLAGSLENMTTADAGVTLTPSADGSPATITINPEFNGSGQAIALNLGNYNGTFSSASSSGITQYSTPGATFTNVSVDQNGQAGSEFKNVSIEADGSVVYNYSNGRSQTLYQISLANFREPDRLDRLDDTTFVATRASGQVVYGNVDDPDNDAGIGRFVPGTVEQSTVDTAEQMTFLIQAQQQYGMNSQIITAADQMLSRLIDLKR